MSDVVEKTVLWVLEEYLDIDQKHIKLAHSFHEDLNTDSLDDIEVIMGLEDAFEITIPDDDAEKFVTVQDAVDYIQGVV